MVGSQVLFVIEQARWEMPAANELPVKSDTWLQFLFLLDRDEPAFVFIEARRAVISTWTIKGSNNISSLESLTSAFFRKKFERFLKNSGVQVIASLECSNFKDICT